MKKFTIVIIGLVVMALVLGSCEFQKGGTIKVTNENPDFTVTIYITKDITDGLLIPPSNVVTKKTIAAKSTGNIIISENNTYYIRPFYKVGPVEIVGTIDNNVAILLAGSIVSVKANFLGQ